MKHYYNITDSVDIKFIILHVINEYGKAIGQNKLTRVIMESANINFFEYTEALEFLANTNQIFRYESDTKELLHDLTDEGRATAKNFSSWIPLEVREYITDEFRRISETEWCERQVTATPVPVNHREFMAQCSLRDNDLLILDMSLFAGSLDSAEEVCRRFRERHDEVYEAVGRILLRPESAND